MQQELWITLLKKDFKCFAFRKKAGRIKSIRVNKNKIRVVFYSK